MTSKSLDDQEISRLVEELHSPRTRREARQKLVAARAVGALLKCLESSNESVAWAAVESLGELRAREAVEPLIGMLQRGRLLLDSCEALIQITGQDHGLDARRWRAAVANMPSDNKLDGGELDGSELDVGECVRRTAELLGAEPTGSGSTYQFRLSLPEGRYQKVAVFFKQNDADGHKLVVVYSECGPAKAKHYEAVLRKNLTIPAGAFAIRDIDGAPNFVMVDTMVADLVTPRALARRIENIAARSDSVEKSISKEDLR